MSRRMASLAKLLKALARDESGIILPYVTIMMVAIMGLATLALDAARYTSFQTQMQAAADALALAGARELDGSTGSQTRATNAINSMLANGLTGFGPDAPTPAAATIAFYSALPAASSGFGGTAATGDGDSKYVGVTLSPATVPTILPVAAVSNQLTTSAQAIAGYDFAVCNMPPVFICNPYEKAGDTNSQANNRWSTQVALPANQQQMMKLTVNGGSGYGPGHFGFLVPPDNCTGAACLKDWVATVHPKACYRKRSVDLNTGQMQSVFDYFNVRFDMYGGGVKASADYAPAINVRKGYLASGKGACNATPVAANTVVVPSFSTTGILKNNSATITSVASTASIIDGMPISDPNSVIPPGTTILSHTSNTITMQSKATSGDGTTTVSIAIGGPGQQAAGLPRDLNIIYDSSALFGNGQWDCQDYWKTVHGGAPPSDTTLGGHCGIGSDTTVTRYQVYKFENQASSSSPGPYLLNDLSGPAAPTDPNGETGAPTCNPPGTAVDSGGGDRRVIYAAIINCGANAALITGGQTADNIPVAGFGKFFMTEPADSGNQALYGEMTGAVGLDKNAKNNVQLYR